MSTRKPSSPTAPQGSTTAKPVPPRITPTQTATPTAPPPVRPAMGFSASAPALQNTASRAAPSLAPTHEEIAQAAYLRWRQHGGDPIINWLEAERELSRR